MIFSKIYFHLKNSITLLVSYPLLVLPTLFLLLFFTIYSKYSVLILSGNSIFSTFFIILTVLISLLLISYILSGTIGLINDILSNSKKKKFFQHANKSFFKVFVINIIILAILNIVRFALTYILIKIGNKISLPINFAVILFFILFFLAIIFLITPFIFAFYFTIISRFSLNKSIKLSFKMYKSKFPETLTFLIIIYLLNRILDSIPMNLSDILNALLILPISLITFTQIFKSAISK